MSIIIYILCAIAFIPEVLCEKREKKVTILFRTVRS